MKIAIYVRDINEAYGLFLGHVDHAELPEVIEMFNQDPVMGIPATLPTDRWHPVYLGDGDRDADKYALIGAQFTPDRTGKNLVFEVVIADQLRL